MRRVPLLVLLAACSGATPEPRPSPSPAAPGLDAGDTIDAGVPVVGTPEAGGGSDGVDGAGEGGPADAGGDAGGTGCAWGGAPGECLTVSACAALPDHSSFAGQCPGPAAIQCCITTPNPADNPPVPAGYTLMAQAQVTAEMTTWAVAILNDPITYPMFSTATKAFGTLAVPARVEWHPPDFQNGAVHRGVTLYVPA